MVKIRSEGEFLFQHGGRRHSYRAFQFAKYGKAHLVDVELQVGSIPLHPAGAQRINGPGAESRFGASFSHRPATGARAVQDDVEGAMISRIDRRSPPGELVIRRENAADKGDDGKSKAFILAYRVDIPPEVAIVVDFLIEAKSIAMASAAIRPERAAIGTPAPGWVLPPARYRPGILVRAVGL